MHNAPSVTYPVGRCRFHAGILLALALAGLLVQCAWWAMAESRGLVSGFVGLGGALFWLGWLALAAWGWRSAPMGRLQWDAQASAAMPPEAGRGTWRWHAAAADAPWDLQGVALVVDLQHRALLRLHRAGGHSLWAWVERRSDPSRWADLRRALRSARG